MTATDVVPLLHVPPGDELVSVVDEPVHTFNTPRIGCGSGLTTNVAVRIQPVGSV
jgi:hypothetical protein